MPRLRHAILIVAAILPSGGSSHFGASGSASHLDRGGPPRTAAPAGLALLQFVPNRGQWHDDVRFAALGDTVGWLHDDGFTLRHERWSNTSGSTAECAPREQSGCVVRTRFLGANTPRCVVGEPLASVHNFFLGNDPKRWCTDVPSYATVTLQEVLPGIDVRFRPLPAGRRGAFEYDLLLAPGADLSKFAARCEGVKALRLDRGRLCEVMAVPDGEVELILEAPVAWQDTVHGRAPVRVVFRLIDECTYGFVVDGLEPEGALTVDPGVVWGTFLGGGATDSIRAQRWQPGAGIWTAGWAGSTDFPTTVGAFRTTGGADAFLARLTEDGTALVFATYLGGALGEEIRGLDLGPGNTATVVGFTRSTDFPVTAGALQPTYGGTGIFVGIGDGFLARFGAAGNTLLGSTYLGGNDDDVAEAVVVGPAGDATVAGWTASANFPSTPGAWQPALSSFPGIQTDGFVTRISPNAQSLGFSTFIGGFTSDQLLDVALDPATGDVVVVGWSHSANYPVTPNALRPTSSGLIDTVVTRLAANGASAVFSTYLGGIDTESAQAVDIASDGSIWIGGFTQSVNFPTTVNAPQRLLGGASDGFACQLDAQGQSILFSTLLGGPGLDKVRGLDTAGAMVIVVGEAGDGFPVTLDAQQSQFRGGNLDAFVSYLNAGSLIYSTYLGGGSQDALQGVTLDSSGIAVVSGWSFSTDFPIAPAAFQGQLLGVEDGIVLSFDLLTDLGDGLAVGPLEPHAEPCVVADGQHDALTALLENVSPRELAIESVRVLVAGAGFAPAHAAALRAFRDDPDQPGAPPVPVAGPMAITADDSELEVALHDFAIAPGQRAVLRLQLEVQSDATGASIEIACAVVEASAWRLHAIGSGQGPAVRVLGSGRVEGRVLVVGALPGDADRDGLWTVADVRRHLSRLGALDRAVDCDGDFVLTAADVALCRDAVLGRPTVVAVPAQLPRDGWSTLRGVFPHHGSLQASLGGRSLVHGTVSPREITLRVDHAQPAGLQDLVVSLDGRVIVTRTVLVP